LKSHEQGGDAVAAARRVLADLEPEYLEVVDFDGQPTLVVAASVGGTRLIDNAPLDRRDDQSRVQRGPEAREDRS
jgi:pantothenate synthetase